MQSPDNLVFISLHEENRRKRIQTILARGRQVAEGRGWGCRAIGWQLWQTPTSSSNARSTSLHPQMFNSTSWWHQIHRWSEFFLVWSRITSRARLMIKWSEEDQPSSFPPPFSTLVRCMAQTQLTWNKNKMCGQHLRLESASIWYFLYIEDNPTPVTCRNDRAKW